MYYKISNRIEENIISILLVSMALLVFIEVLMRFAFNAGFIWMEELTLTLNAWFVLFGMSYGVKVGAHIGVDAFVKKLPPIQRKLAALFTIFLCLAYCLFFLYGSLIYLQKMYQIGISMEDIHVPQFIVALFSEETLWQVFKIDSEDPLIPIWLSQSILLLGFMLLFFRFLQLFIKVLQGKSQGFSFADEAEESMHLIQEDDLNKQSENQKTNGEQK
jgi:C4-dicarboxylate transporter, DctQ subunit